MSDSLHTSISTSTEDLKQQSATATEAPVEPQKEDKKKSLYQRWVDAKTHRNVRIPDEDLVKYTGMTKAQLADWSKDRPGVAGNQAAGTLAMGQATGFGGLEAYQGYGGWGPDAAGKLEFPPGQRDIKEDVVKGKEGKGEDGN